MDAQGDASKKRGYLWWMNLRSLIRSILLESAPFHGHYLIDHEGYYSIPDVSSMLDTIQSKGQLPMFYKMHYVNLAGTEAKKELQDAGIEYYDYPEGIENVIEGGKRFLELLSDRIRSVYGPRAIDQLNNMVKSHIDDIPMG